MIGQALAWMWRRWRPAEGWLSFGLLLSLVGCLALAVVDAAWIPETTVVIPAGLLGLLLGSVLARRPLAPAAAWSLIASYGVLVNIVWLARLWPPLTTLASGWWATSSYWRQAAALFIDRVGSWVRAAATGGASQETAAFALGLGVLVYFLAALIAWSTYAQRQPLRGVTVAGLAMALNAYYSDSSIYWLALFVALAVMTTTMVGYANLARRWRQQRMDYSDQIEPELALSAGGVALALMALSLLLPFLSVARLSAWLADQPAVQTLDTEWNRLFGGVAQPRPDSGPGAAASGGAGVMPRAFLLGNAPELAETVVMTATVTVEQDGRDMPLLTRPARGHWRALSYVTYTGRGWSLSEERQESLPAGAAVPLPAAKGQTRLQQAVNWSRDQRRVRYTLGQPLRFDQAVEVTWRGLSDLVRVTGSGTRYRVVTRLTTASPTALRAARLADVPPVILARYTQLPDSLPVRVSELAAQVAGSQSNPYDQATALEQFLHQYTYSLEVAPPPPGTEDLVDYFLFSLQSGYCDYYASAMAVMARSLGLPARVAIGYLAQPPTGSGVQTVYEINAHSWAEIYFAGYGWVEFEPTAPFAPSPEATPTPGAAAASPAAPVPPPLPPRDATGAPLARVWLALPLLLAALAGLLWRRRRQSRSAAPDELSLAYARLQRRAVRLGIPAPASQTPAEFEEAWRGWLQGVAGHRRWGGLAVGLGPPLAHLISRFAARQYGPRKETDTDSAGASWRRLRRPLWLLQLARRTGAFLPAPAVDQEAPT